MKSRLSLFLASLTLLASLSGCSAMLPIAGALVLKEAADRYEAMSKPQEAKPEPAAAVIAAIPDDAAPQVEADPDAAATHVASIDSTTPRSSPILNQEPIASAQASETALDDQPLASKERTVSAVVHPVLRRRANPDEHTDEEIEASRRVTFAQPDRSSPSAAPSKAESKPTTKPVSKSALAAPKSGTASRKPDATTASDQKAKEIVKAASSIPTTEAAASESATDSAARILATALKQIPNPQAAPATKPAPITPQKPR
ncbi:MAG: hypothetical protein KF805_01000 [Phycisphaeraceae bacterium]|nr:hypothetical protein [Phycisphaeraceae bacterium]